MVYRFSLVLVLHPFHTMGFHSSLASAGHWHGAVVTVPGAVVTV